MRISEYLENRKFVCLAAGALCAYLALWYAMYGAFAVVVTDSINHRFFYLTRWKYNNLPQKGQYLNFTMVHPQEHIMVNVTKEVGCAGGDTLLVRGLEYFCNGEHIATATERFADGTPKIRYTESGTIPPGQAFAIGHYFFTNGWGEKIDASYDSRYIGLVEVKNTLKAVPIW